MHEAEAAYLRHLATVAETWESPGVLAVRTGVASNTENGVLSTTASIAPETIAFLIEWFAGTPASWLALDPAIGPALVAAGCTAGSDAWSMEHSVEVDASPTDDLVRAVSSEADLAAWLGVLVECGWYEDTAPVRRLYTSLGFDEDSAVRLYVADDGAAAAFYDPPTVLLTTVAVLPRSRRRGIGRALALARLDDARRRGCTKALLAPSPDGAKLYESLGFEYRRQPSGHWFHLP